MLDEEVREQLDLLNRERTWLVRAAERFPDLCIYRRDEEPRYCSPSMNASAAEFNVAAVIDRSPYHDHPPEQNVAVWCYAPFEGKDVYSWPPKFIVGSIDEDGGRHLYAHWDRQLRDAEMSTALIARLADELSDYPIERNGRDWKSGDPDYDVWTAQDETGEVVGVVRVHERLNLEARCAIRTRAAALGIRFFMHDGGYTIESAHDLQAFVDDTVDFYAERELDRPDEDIETLNDQQQAA